MYEDAPKFGITPIRHCTASTEPQAAQSMSINAGNNRQKGSISRFVLAGARAMPSLMIIAGSDKQDQSHHHFVLKLAVG